MRLKISILLVLVFISLTGFHSLITPVHITGHLKKNSHKQDIVISGLQIFIRGNGKVLATSITDQKGDFFITFTPDKEKTFDFFCAGLGVDTLLIASFQNFESDMPELTFYMPARRTKNAIGQTLCIICKKADKVYPIKYGDGLVISRKITKAGDTVYSHIVNGNYNEAGCIGGVATYYCDRDKVRF